MQTPSRRQFLVGAASVGGAVVALSAAGPLTSATAAVGSDQPTMPQLVGLAAGGATADTMVMTTARRPRLVDTSSGKYALDVAASVTVHLTAALAAWRGAMVGLDAFAPGEEIVAYGSWTDDTTFAADRVEPVLYPIRDTVTLTKGRRATTPSGSFLWDDNTRVLVTGLQTRSPDQIVRAGQLLGGSVTGNRAGGLPYACRLEALAAA